MLQVPCAGQPTCISPSLCMQSKKHAVHAFNHVSSVVLIAKSSWWQVPCISQMSQHLRNSLHHPWIAVNTKKEDGSVFNAHCTLVSSPPEVTFVRPRPMKLVSSGNIPCSAVFLRRGWFGNEDKMLL